MEFDLSEEEVRVLGCLIEKEYNTPEYYPLTFNALRTACNQKSNRDPVVSYSEQTIDAVLESLRLANLARKIVDAHGRVARYGHRLDALLGLDRRRLAVLCALMLRGAQTPGEIRGRTGRLHEFKTLGDLEAVLDGLAQRDGGALVRKLPRQPGSRESRWCHLLSGEPAAEAIEEEEADENAGQTRMNPLARIEQLEKDVESLRAQLGDLQGDFQTFKRQFE